MKTKIKDDRGAVMIVEATIVFPVVFLILFLLIYLGNAYYLKARIDSNVTQYAIAGAAQCADPMLSSINPNVPTSVSDVDVKPYRYLFHGHMEDIGRKVNDSIKRAVSDSGFFSTMDVSVKTSAAPKVSIFYSTFYVQAEYSIKFPLRILGMELDLLKFNSYSEIPIVDAGEFIRNVDMALDYVESSKVIQDALGKAKEFLNNLNGGTK